MADLDAGAKGTMTSALLPDKIRPIVMQYLDGNKKKSLEQWYKCIPLINHENRQCGLRGCKTIFAEGNVIKSDRVRHPLKPLSKITKQRLIQLSKDLDILALKWGK